MRAFLYDMYGYYPPNDDDHEFDLDDWHFRLEELTHQTEEELIKINDFASSVASQFGKYGVQIITNRDGRLVSQDEYGNVALIAIKNGNVNLQEIVAMHLQYKEAPMSSYTIQHLISLWEEKITIIEEKALPSIKVDDFAYQKIMVAAIHALGLAENAIQYLAEIEIDFGPEINSLTLCHRRLDSLSTLSVFDPLNFLLDNPIRDLAELWKAHVINSEELIAILPQYSLTIKDASLLLARLLYPTKLFDLLEKHYSEKIDVRTQLLAYYRNMKLLMFELQKMEKYLVYTYGIRPISWIES